MHINILKRFAVVLFLFVLPQVANAKGVGLMLYKNNTYQVDSVKPKNTPVDTAKIDSSQVKKNKKKEAFEDPVKYSANDSMVIDMTNKRVHLYGDSKVAYQKIDLQSGYLEFDMPQQTVFATTIKDTAGNDVGKPNFKEGSEQFDAQALRYNFKTKKGFITSVKTKQDDGYLHGDSTKRQANGNVDLKHAKYTTCSLDHPHYYISLTKAKSVPGDKIVTGPAYLVLGDIPLLPIGIPFGYFPNTSSYSSGLIIPTWGEDSYKGFYLREGGYYFYINDKLDARITGDIYSKLSWGIKAQTNYAKRYRYRGGFAFSYYSMVTSEEGLPDYSKEFNYNIRWSHSQDAKANPNSTFGASVDMSSSGYDKKVKHDIASLTRNNKQSSVNYSYHTTDYNLTMSANHSQSSYSGTIDEQLPSMSFTLNTLYPFQNKESAGDGKWYENVSVGYTSKLENNIHTTDSAFFTSRMFENMDNGFTHNIPISTNFKINSFINLSPSINYTGVMYTRYITKELGDYDTTKKKYDIKEIEHKQLEYAHAVAPSVSLGITPKFYGMYMFKDSKIKAIRHVMSPSATFSFVPDIRSFSPDYYRTLTDSTGKIVQRYSIFEKGKYGTPVPNGKSGSISFYLRNNFEMKYLSESDTSVDEKKISLLDNFDFSANYTMFRDSMGLSNIGMNAGTSLFDKKLSIQFSGTIDPYVMNKAGNGDTKYYAISNNPINKSRSIGRLIAASISLNTSFTSAAGDKNKTQKQPVNNNLTNLNSGLSPNQQNQLNMLNENYDVNYDIPWSINLAYNWSYDKPYRESSVTQTVRVSGDLSLTKKWKIGFNTGYDFTNKEISITSVNVSRDLHCWEMRFNWIPFGFSQSYNFSINVKSNILKDLKYDKNKYWYDSY